MENLKILFHFLYLTLLKVKIRLNLLDKLIHKYNDTFIPLAVKILNMNFNLDKLDTEQTGFQITWTGQELFDNSINAMKSRCLVFLNYYLELNKGADLTIHILRIFSGLVDPLSKALLDNISTKYNLISQFDQVMTQIQENSYQRLIYEILIFLAYFLSKNAVVKDFNPYINK
jgi:hypothetical protein